MGQGQLKLSKNEIRQKVDSHLHGNANKGSKWSEMMADALMEKNFVMLSELCSHGKGHNDKSKEVLCEILGVKRTYTLKGMKALIASHCEMQVESIDMHYDYFSAKEQLGSAKEALEENVGNAAELVALVHEQVNAGFNKIETIKRKKWLTNGCGRGWQLGQKQFKEYAIAYLAYMEIKTLFHQNQDLNRSEEFEGDLAA